MKKILSSSDIDILLNEYQLVFANYGEFIYSDIDLAIEFESSFSDIFLNNIRAFGIPMVGGSRLNKIQQSIVLERLGINQPKCYFNRQKNTPFRKKEEVDAYVDFEDIVVKPISGARGIGVKLMKRKDYIECLQDKNVIKDHFIKEIEYVKQYDDISLTAIEDFFTWGMLVQQFINVAREFRCLIFADGNILLYERIKNANQFCGNLSFGSKAAPVDRETYIRITCDFMVNLKALLKDLNYPWLSVDLYIDDQNNMGIFEFQMEFAYDGFDHKDVRTALKNAIEFCITKK